MTDMTVGSPSKHLIRHALPLLIGNWLQLSYNAIDSIIAGRFIGEEALAAEGIAAPVMNLVILAISGLCIGAGILMSEAFGAKQYEKVRKVLSNTVMAGVAVSTVLAALGIALTDVLLKILSVPDDISGITAVYLRITFIGAPFTFCYNSLTAGLKSVGDTKTPLIFLSFSAILNAVLDLVFIGIFRFGIVCSALTTVFAEAVCAIMSLIYMRKKLPQLYPSLSGFRFDAAVLRQVLRYGTPTALQQSIQPICKVLIQGEINSLGVSSIAAFNAVTRFDDFACIPAQGISSSISTYIAQNRGAGKKERIRRGFRAGLGLEALYWVIVASITFFFREPLISLFVKGEGASEVIKMGSEYLFLMVFIYFLPTMTNGFQGFYRGMAMMKTMMLGSFIQASTRTVCVYLLADKLGISGVAYSCAIGWTLMLLAVVPYYFVVCKKQGLKIKNDG